MRAPLILSLAKGPARKKILPVSIFTKRSSLSQFRRFPIINNQHHHPPSSPPNRQDGKLDVNLFGGDDIWIRSLLPALAALLFLFLPRPAATTFRASTRGRHCPDEKGCHRRQHDPVPINSRPNSPAVRMMDEFCDGGDVQERGTACPTLGHNIANDSRWRPRSDRQRKLYPTTRHIADTKRTRESTSRSNADGRQAAASDRNEVLREWTMSIQIRSTRRRPT